MIVASVKDLDESGNTSDEQLPDETKTAFLNEDEFERRLKEILGNQTSTEVKSGGGENGTADGQENNGTTKMGDENSIPLTGVSRVKPEPIAQFSALDNYILDEDVNRKE